MLNGPRESFFRPYYFGSELENPPTDQIKFHRLLQHEGFTINIFKLGFGGKKEKKVDIALAMEMIYLVLKGVVDTVILISGDKDFVPLLKRVKAEGG